ncbi:hypothetical protein U1Q18_004323 [Sarracenia purpurea var. burkii]
MDFLVLTSDNDGGIGIATMPTVQSGGSDGSLNSNEIGSDDEVEVPVERVLVVEVNNCPVLEDMRNEATRKAIEYLENVSLDPKDEERFFLVGASLAA